MSTKILVVLSAVLLLAPTFASAGDNIQSLVNSCECSLNLSGGGPIYQTTDPVIQCLNQCEADYMNAFYTISYMCQNLKSLLRAQEISSPAYVDGLDNLDDHCHDAEDAFWLCKSQCTAPCTSC